MSLFLGYFSYEHLGVVSGSWASKGVTPEGENTGTNESGAQEYLVDLLCLEESEGKVTRVINYFFCPDTLAYAATALG
jgi:hypothetical protein